MRITNKMFTILLVIILVNFKIISGADTSDDNFINSLPEDQKREFLEKVEERINKEVPEVKTPAGNDTNVDLYEQQLENQGKSIQNILRTEIDRLQRRNLNDTLANRRFNLKEEDDSHIDLTVRSRKNKRRAEIDGEGKPVKTVLIDNKNQESDIIPVLVKYDSETISPEKGSSYSARDVKKKNEITWIKTSSTKSLDTSNISNPVNISKTSRRIDYIDTTPRSANLNDSLDATDGPMIDKVNASTYHESSDSSPIAVETSKEVINLNMKPSNDISATENIVVSTEKNTHVKSQIQNEKDNGTKGNIILSTDDGNYTQQNYTDSQPNYAGVSTTVNNYFSKTIDESSSLTLDKVYTVSDIVVDSTVKYDVDAYSTNGVNNENINVQNIGDSTTQYEVDIGTILDDVNDTTHILNNHSILNNNHTVANDVYNNAPAGDASSKIISVDNSTLKNYNLPLNNINGSINTVNSTLEITNNPISATHDNITPILDSSEGNITFKSNYMTTDAGNDKPNSDYLATTEAFYKNQPNDVIHSSIMHNLFGSSLLGKASHAAKYDTTENNNIASVTTNNLVGSTILGDADAETDDFYHTTTANYINGLTDSLPSSTKLGDVNAPNEGIDESVTVNIIKEITTDDLVGVTKLGYVDPDARDEYYSATFKSQNIKTASPSGSTVLGDVSAEKYGKQSTPTDTINAVTENIAGSTKLGNFDIVLDVIGPMNQDAKLKGSKTLLIVPDNLKVVLNFGHYNNTYKKSKLDIDPKTTNTDLLKSVTAANNSKKLGDISKHFALSMKEDENTYRVYEVDTHKNSGSTPDPLLALFKYLRSIRKETSDSKLNDNIESHPHYVRVYNYDPENAYFNADDLLNPSGKKERENPIIVKETEKRSKSTKLDIHLSVPFNTSNPSINDKKDTLVSYDNDVVNVDESIFGDDNSDSFNGNVKAVESKLLEDNTPFEKPLKRGLNKIRQILFSVKNQGNEKKSNDHVIDKYSNQIVLTPISDLQNKHAPQKHAAKDHKKGINDIIAQVKRLVDSTKNSETSASYNKKDSFSDTHYVGDIRNSFKISQNPDIQQLIETLANIEDKNNKIINAKSRFKIKDSDGKYLKKDLGSTKQEPYNIEPSDIPEDIYVKAKEFEESKPILLDDKYLELHVNTLKDFVAKDDVALNVYDWLGTTVLIQAGIEKLQHIVDIKLNHKRLHPLDQQLLDFVIDLHLAAEEVTETYKEDIASQRRFSFPKPKPKKRKSHRSLHKLLNDIKRGKTRKRSGHDVNDLEDFLKSLKRALNDLHTAITEISVVTKYRSQHWFRDIKHLYLKSAGARGYLELLLHITTARLIELLDESAKKMLAEDEDFVRKNRARIERIGVEFMMVLRIYKEWEQLN